MRIIWLPIIILSIAACNEKMQNSIALKTVAQSISLSNIELGTEIRNKQIILDSILRLQNEDNATAGKKYHFNSTWKDLSAFIDSISAGILKETGFNPPERISGPDESHPGLVEKAMKDNGRLLFQKLVDFESQLYLLDSVLYRENKAWLPLNLPLGKYEKADEDNFGTFLFTNISPMMAITVLNTLKNKMLFLVNNYLGSEIKKKSLTGNQVQ